MPWALPAALAFVIARYGVSQLGLTHVVVQSFAVAHCYNPCLYTMP